MCTSCIWLLVVAILFIIFTLWEIWYLNYIAGKALKKARESEILVKLLWNSPKSTKKENKIPDLSDPSN